MLVTHTPHEYNKTINLSILDFKYSEKIKKNSRTNSINLSILDFKLIVLNRKVVIKLDYKSIHIGF